MGSGGLEIRAFTTDSLHHAGGPLCCLVEITSDSSRESNATLDFISICAYGILKCRKKSLKCSRFQSSLVLPFLTQKRQNISSKEQCLLVFTSDTMIFHTSDDSINHQDRKYCFKCTLPPFIPPSFTNPNTFCRYFVYITAQSRICKETTEIQLKHAELEFNVVGSIYDDIPVLSLDQFPILPKTHAMELQEHLMSSERLEQLCSDIISNTAATECWWFDFNLERGETGDLESQKVKLTRDLNVLWSIWDSLYSNCEMASLKLDYGPIFKDFEANFKSIVATDSQDFSTLSAHSCMFTLQENEPIQYSQEWASGFLNLLKQRCLVMTREQFGIVENIGKRTFVFKCEGQGICTCTLNGMNEMNYGDGKPRLIVLRANCWFTLTFDFQDAQCHCLEIDVDLLQIQSLANDKEYKTPIASRTCSTVNHRKCSVSLLIPIDATPSFTSKFLSVGYRLELCFHCIPGDRHKANIDTVQRQLDKVKMIHWHEAVILRQSSASAISRCYNYYNKPTSDTRALVQNLQPPNVFGSARSRSSAAIRLDGGVALG
ncbi:hypothetical protein BdWA1_000228 [Babesia duncani]|uniref:Uncharacterized protein n=1 Tax=Babesia duncani TaxID=323732 RepID=A0AAD9UPU0_9APIC|nr:hypothetical protein BdWA1_000228 [Babesia duncani]